MNGSSKCKRLEGKEWLSPCVHSGIIIPSKRKTTVRLRLLMAKKESIKNIENPQVFNQMIQIKHNIKIY
jgi:hypothetical protein